MTPSEQARLIEVERKAEQLLRERAELHKLVTLLLQAVRQAAGGS